MKNLIDNGFYILAGALLVVLAYFFYLALTKGTPVAITWAKAAFAALKAWWTNGEARLAAIEADILTLKRQTGLAPAATAAPTPPAPTA